MIHEFIKRHEGIRLKPYTDSLGHITIGWGRNLDTAGITREEADYLFVNDVTRATNAAMRVYGDRFGDLAPARQAALIAMAYQLGEAGLAGFKNMLAFMRSGDFRRAAEEAMESRWATQTLRRAHETATMIETGKWPGE